jgi:hypothetical protein
MPRFSFAHFAARPVALAETAAPRPLSHRHGARVIDLNYLWTQYNN